MRCSLWLEEVRPWSDTATTRRSSLSLSLSLNSAWWCAEAQHTGHQSLRLRHDSIFARLPAINWQFRHIGGSHTVVGRSLSPVRRRGTLCRNVYATLLIVLPFFGRHLKHLFLRLLLEALTRMRYTNGHLTLYYGSIRFRVKSCEKNRSYDVRLTFLAVLLEVRSPYRS